MQTIKQGVASLSLIAHINFDRVLVLGLTGGALFAAAFMVSL